MRKTIYLLLIIIVPSLCYAESTADIIKEICQGEDNCFACTDSSKQSLNKCVDKNIFNPQLENASNLHHVIFGGLSQTSSTLVCGNTATKEMCTKQAQISTEPYEKEITLQTYGNSNGRTGYSDSRVWCDRNGCYQHMKVIGHKAKCWAPFCCDYRRDTDCVIHREEIITLKTFVVDGSIETFFAGRHGSLNEYRFGDTIYTHQQNSQNVESIIINTVIKSNSVVEKVSYKCASDSSYSCVSDNNGGSYFCTPTPCFTLNPDNSLTEKDKVSDSLTPEYIPPDNNTCPPDMNLYLFTPVGNKHKECRQKGLNFTANDLTSPNQCVRQESLSNEAKESLLGGLNKTFDKLKSVLDPGSAILGDWSILINPAGFVLKAYELIGEFIIKNLAEDPSQEEKDLSLLRSSYGEDGACEKIGEYCSKYNLDGMYELNKNGSIKYDLTSCSRRNSLYCCYDSPIAKAFNKAAREQLPGFTWGEDLNAYSSIQSRYKQPKPNCRGLTIAELSKININDPRFSDEMKAYVNNVLMPELTGPGGMLDIARLQETSKKMADDIQNYYK